MQLSECKIYKTKASQNSNFKTTYILSFSLHEQILIPELSPYKLS